MAKLFERRLYRDASNFNEYNNHETLENRLQHLVEVQRNNRAKVFIVWRASFSLFCVSQSFQ